MTLSKAFMDFCSHIYIRYQITFDFALNLIQERSHLKSETFGIYIAILLNTKLHVDKK